MSELRLLTRPSICDIIVLRCILRSFLRFSRKPPKSAMTSCPGGKTLRLISTEASSYIESCSTVVFFLSCCSMVYFRPIVYVLCMTRLGSVFCRSRAASFTAYFKDSLRGRLKLPASSCVSSSESSFVCVYMLLFEVLALRPASDIPLGTGWSVIWIRPCVSCVTIWLTPPLVFFNVFALSVW